MKVLRSLEKIRSLNTRKNSESSEESSQLLKSDEGMQVWEGWPKIGDGHYPWVLALSGALVLFMSGGLSLGYRKGRHLGHVDCKALQRGAWP